jgi:hypothetical protein
MLKLTPVAYALLLTPLLGAAGLGEIIIQPKAAIAAPAPQGSTPLQNPSRQRASTQGKFGGFFAPKGRAMPQDSEGGASRGLCLQNHNGLKQTVTLLTPEGNSGLTASARPSFMAYVDQAAAKQVFFSLKNEDESYFFEMTLNLPSDRPGLVKFQLPDNAPALEQGEQYRWSVAVICGNKLGPDSPWASGWVERINPSEQGDTLALAPLERASHYGRAGLWYETVELLASLKESEPQASVEAAWSKLLSDGGLDELLK